MKRFVKEYANYKTRKWCDDDQMNPAILDKCADLLSKYLQAYDAGLITTDEVMSVLAHLEERAVEEVYPYL